MKTQKQKDWKSIFPTRWQRLKWFLGFDKFGQYAHYTTIDMKIRAFKMKYSNNE